MASIDVTVTLSSASVPRGPACCGRRDTTARLLAVPDDGHFAVLDPATQHRWLSFYLQHLEMTLPRSRT